MSGLAVACGSGREDSDGSGDENTASCAVGTEGCSCYPTLACDPPLTCQANQCTSQGAAASGGSSSLGAAQQGGAGNGGAASDTPDPIIRENSGEHALTFEPGLVPGSAIVIDFLNYGTTRRPWDASSAGPQRVREITYSARGSSTPTRAFNIAFTVLNKGVDSCPAAGPCPDEWEAYAYYGASTSEWINVIDKLDGDRYRMMSMRFIVPSKAAESSYELCVGAVGLVL